MVLDNFRIDGKVAIVTGCNTGLGQGMACALAEAGADVVGINQAEPTETIARVEGLGRRFLDLRANVAEISGLEGLVSQAVAWGGHVDILVNNAGIIRRADSIDFTEADWDAVMDTNLKVVFFLTQAFARQALKQGPVNGVAGKVINIASLLSFQGGIRVPG